eukprot:8982054-Pyramimonas_sp.AAC.1
MVRFLLALAGLAELDELTGTRAIDLNSKGERRLSPRPVDARYALRRLRRHRRPKFAKFAEPL